MGVTIETLGRGGPPLRGSLGAREEKGEPEAGPLSRARELVKPRESGVFST